MSRDGADDAEADAPAGSVEQTLAEPVLEGDDSLLERQGVRFQRNVDRLRSASGAVSMLRVMVGMLPQMMFVLLPLLPMIAMPFYRSSGRYYVEHAIFMMHNHAFVFLVFLPAFVVSAIRNWGATEASVSTGWLGAALLLWAHVYVLVAMKRFYEESWLRTAVKYAVLTSIYYVLPGIAVAVLTLLAILTM